MPPAPPPPEVVFVSPELAGWGSVGGLGAMVAHLAAALAARGLRVSVVLPHYASRGGGSSGAPHAAAHLFDLSVPLEPSRGDAPLSVLHGTTEGGVRVYLLQSDVYFRAPYAHRSPADALLSASLLSRGALLLLERLSASPAALLSNDWVAALAAPYARHGAWRRAARPGGGRSWPERWRGTTFVHLVHNLEPGYDGALK
mmetsp:Transcript_22548/g.74367  ORF Transcript_22548/g.74367 Transcript_22548/m.74367 type:complete len:200 (-) Transcript_22548:206-805(-)